MTITSFWYFLLLACGAVIYYIAPKKVQWVILLILSVIFYCYAAEPYSIVFLILSTGIAYFTTVYISKQQNENREENSKRAAIASIIGVIANLVIWFLLKGSSFWTFGSVLIQRAIPSFPYLDALPIIGALGMGYYTAQIMGYILDVHWGNIKPQKNPIKLFLFVSFFPQLIVGPISQYSELSQLYDKHYFSYRNLAFGSQRILWGLFKKLVIADRIAVLVNAIWLDTVTFNGIWPWIAFVLYPIEIYADFSGCMDIILGSAELFDIQLAENFNNPFFSRNMQEFWQRWHITLGRWAKTYVFYPFMKSGKMVKLQKNAKKKFGKKWGKFIAWSISLAVLWFVMGFWHGGVQYIIGVSFFFWAVLFISELTAPFAKKINEKLEIKTNSFSWHLFQSARTYILYAFGALFFAASGLHVGFNRFFALIRSFNQMNLWSLFDGTLLKSGFMYTDINIVIIGVICMIITAILREKYGSARIWVQNQSFGFRWVIWLFLLALVIIFGKYGTHYDASEFIYQGF